MDAVNVDYGSRGCISAIGLGAWLVENSIANQTAERPLTTPSCYSAAQTCWLKAADGPSRS